jgi:hypothetical protein
MPPFASLTHLSMIRTLPAGRGAKNGAVDGWAARKGTSENSSSTQFVNKGKKEGRSHIALIGVIAIAVIIATTVFELAPYGPLGILPVGDVNVEPMRVVTELQA